MPAIPRPRGRGLIEARYRQRRSAARPQFHDRAVVASLKLGLIEADGLAKFNSTTARSWPH